MMKSFWRTYRGKMPKELIPLYEILQEELNYVLSNKDIRHKILHEVNYDVIPDNSGVLTEYNNLFGKELQKRPNWVDVPVKSWYFRMLAENIRRTYESLKEKVYNLYLS